MEQTNNFRPEPYILGGISESFPSGADLNDYTDINIVYYSANSTTTSTLINKPPFNAGFSLKVECNGGTRLIQIAKGAGTNNNAGVEFRRMNNNSGWGPWYKFEGTMVE